MDEELIAPCGMNCAVCIGYLFRQKDLNRQGFHKTYCTGCRPRGRIYMSRHCELVGKGLVRFCYECPDYPCRQLKALDKRYRTKYHLSMLHNLEFIQKHGITKFLEKEAEKWHCPDCGGTICCHNGLCLSCNLDTLKRNKKYRWGEN